MRRGDLVLVALPGDHGKPRPAWVIQSDLFETHPSATVLPVTSEHRDVALVRILLEPNGENGLQRKSYVMVDKVQSIPRQKVRDPFGHLEGEALAAVDRALATFLGLA